MKFMMLKWN